MKIIINESQLKITINELFSDKLINNLIDKFKQQEPNPTVIINYINRFQQIKDNPNIKEKDINKYSWDQLEDIIVNNPKEFKTSIVDKQKDTIYNQNNLEIILANSKDACIKYGEGYNFCISARSHDNAFEIYRDDKTIYFVIDHDRSKEKNEEGSYIDPLHLLVVMRYDNTKYSYQGFYVTDANNNVLNTPTNNNTVGLPPQVEDWDDLVNAQPKLKGLEHLFNFVDPEPKLKLKQFYEHKLNLLFSRYYNILTVRDKRGKLPVLDGISKKSWDIVNNIFSKGKRYILYDKDKNPIIGQIRMDDLPITDWVLKMISKNNRFYQANSTYEITDFNDYPKEYPNYINQGKQIIKDYYRELHSMD